VEASCSEIAIKLNLTCQTKKQTQPSYLSNYLLLKKIDSLPAKPGWKYKTIKVKGDAIGVDGKPATKSIELWFRDPIECMQGLIGNPTFREHMSYVPQKVFTSRSGTTRIYDETWTGDWWWTMQVREQVFVDRPYAC
jgi:hypothetical protein